MKTDKVLERLDLERRKTILIASKNKIKDGIEIKTNRGIFIYGNRYMISKIEWDIIYQIKEIDKKLEELTGLNQERMDYLNREV